MKSNQGDVIVVMYEYAIYGKGQTIHSSIQIEANKNIAHDKSVKVGGLQCIITNDAYVLPLNIVNGLPYLPMRPHTDEEWETLPHVPLTQDNEWNPTSLDSVIR